MAWSKRPSIAFICLVLTANVHASDDNRYLTEFQRNLKYVPGLGYVDLASVLMLAAIPVLILVGLGSFLAPLFTMLPTFLSGLMGAAGTIPTVTTTASGRRKRELENNVREFLIKFEKAIQTYERK